MLALYGLRRVFVPAGKYPCTYSCLDHKFDRPGSAGKPYTPHLHNAAPDRSADRNNVNLVCNPRQRSLSRCCVLRKLHARHIERHWCSGPFDRHLNT
jgi:hypothetical protein